MPHVVRCLRWSDVDPAGRAFDPAPARAAVAERIGGAARRPASRHGDRALEESVDRAVVAAYGAWAAGWCWATSEPGGGGPVRGWCCARDSLLVGDDEEAAATINRVVAALVEWRAFLEELAAVFAELHVTLIEPAIEDRVAGAAAYLLPIVVQRTHASDAWYATFERVLLWYLESDGHDPDVVGEAVAGVISGRFASWVEPSADAARTACAELGYEVALAAAAPPQTRDALAAWRIRRGDLAQHAPTPRPREPVSGDAHRRYIDGPERARDPERAARMAGALGACRASARRGERLTFERLAAWQAIVLGEPAAFRTGDAHAKGGRERYGLAADTRRHFDAALSEANDEATRVSVRAARVYLDVCFFHPFHDGNARAARLALDHVLTRAGCALHAVEPLFVVARSADRGQGSFLWMVEYLLGVIGPT